MTLNHKKWDKRFLKFTEEVANWSKDPSTQVGAVITRDKKIIGIGYNGLPKRLEDTIERLMNRELKYQLVVHAEVNAILDTKGEDLSDATMYMVARDSTGQVWGGAPCVRCLVHIMQTNLNRIVTYPFKSAPSRWEENLRQSRELMDEVGMEYVEYDKC